jgi:hypothetical protein
MKYEVTLRTHYGSLTIDDIEADNYDEAVDKAYYLAEDALWTSKVDEVREY